MYLEKQNEKIHLPFNVAILLLGIYPTEIKKINR